MSSILPPAWSLDLPSATDAERFAADDPGSAIAQARLALDAYVAQPDQPERLAQLRAELRAAGETIAGHPARALTGASGEAVRKFVSEVSASGAHDAPATDEDLGCARALAARGPFGLLAAMLLTPSWQWPDAPALARVPEGLIADYVAWLIAPPQGFVAHGQAEIFSARYLLRLEDILRFARTQPGAALGRTALAAYLKWGNCIPLYFCADSLRRHYGVRAQLLQCAAVRPAVKFSARPRAGRRLRVGIINRHFGSQTETYTTLPTFEQLDPERFEVLLFAHQSNGSPLEEYARRHAAEFTVLPADPGAQVDLLRAAALDVAVFGTNVTAVFNEVTRLALHRLAPLQVVNNSSCTTSGLPEIDLYVSGTATESAEAPGHFTERLGLVTGPAHAFNYEADKQESAGTFTRATLGVAQDVIVFVSAANYYKIIPEMREAWARLLAAVPGSRLLLHPFNPNWSSSYPIQRFCAEFGRVLAAHGVAGERLIVSSRRFPSRTDVKELLRVGDVYLDTFPFGGVNSLVDPLEIGVPVVAWEGATMRSRMGAALLRQLRLPELIAPDEATYLAIATRLATDATQRHALRDRIRVAMEAPLFLDALAASDQFGGLLETAFDELVAVGHAEFRRARAPLHSPAGTPIDAVGRQLHASALLAAGRTARAVDYLLAAITNDPNDAAIWCDLAGALRRHGQLPQAVQALETSLRIDPQRREAWQLLNELAVAAGADELAQEAAGMMGALAAASSAAE